MIIVHVYLKISYILFRSKLHDIYTQLYRKIVLSNTDDKRCIREDGVNTYAWGHYMIDKDTPMDID